MGHRRVVLADLEAVIGFSPAVALPERDFRRLEAQVNAAYAADDFQTHPAFYIDNYPPL